MDRELEALLQQTLHHQAQLVLGGRARRLASNLVPLGIEPVGAGDLVIKHVPCPRNTGFQARAVHGHRAWRDLNILAQPSLATSSGWTGLNRAYVEAG